MGKTLADIRFIDLLPGSIATDPTICAAADALDEVLSATRLSIRNVALFSRIEEIEEPLLSELAWQLHVDYWDAGFSVETKRAMIATAIQRHRRKGTPAAVEEMLRAVMGSGLVAEWFHYGGEPYCFRVEMDLAVTDWGLIDQALIAQLALTYKNARSWLDGVFFYIASRGVMRYRQVVTGGETVCIRPRPAPVAIESRGAVYYAVGRQSAETITVYPEET